MKLDYATLISPYPFYIKNVGGIKSPTLREIWNPTVTYQGYQMYLALLLATPQKYCEHVMPSVMEWYQSLSEQEKLNVNMMDIIVMDKALQISYCKMLNFFFEEDVVWSNEDNLFITYKDVDEQGQIIPIGLIHRNIFTDLCDIILQRCGIVRSDIDTDASKVKSKRALEILKKLQRGREKAAKTSVNDKDTELPKLITAVAVKSKSINFTNIWDLTLFQFYEQFKKEQTNVYFDISATQVAAYGNEKKTFKGNEWYIDNQ